MKYILSIIMFVVLFTGILMFSFGSLDLLYSKFIGKEKESIKREIYEETPSYIQGKKEEILNYYREYNKANEVEKEIIKNYVRESIGSFDEEKHLNGALLEFARKCKYE